MWWMSGGSIGHLRSWGAVLLSCSLLIGCGGIEEPEIPDISLPDTTNTDSTGSGSDSTDSGSGNTGSGSNSTGSGSGSTGSGSGNTGSDSTDSNSGDNTPPPDPVFSAPIVQVEQSATGWQVQWNDARGEEYRVMLWGNDEQPQFHLTSQTHYNLGPLDNGQYALIVEGYDDKGNSLFSTPVEWEVSP